MRKTKIICTIGPASEKREILSQIIEAGMNVSRHNFSHGDHAEHAERINLVKELAKEHNKEIAVMLDTKGPEIRTGKFEPKKVELQAGAKFTVHAGGDVIGNTEECSVTYAGLASDVKAGDTILIDDGLVGLTVESIEGNKIHCTVQNTGFVATHKGVNVPGVSIKLPALTEKDIADLKFGCEIGVNAVAASFIRKASDVETIRQILNENGGEDIKIISKIENQEGVDNIDAILEASDGLMVARGDLGVEVPTEEMPIIQKDMIRKCNELGKPVITATQMLDSMIRNPRPTRAEVTDVANAIYDGTDAIMLSGETAAGKYPVEAVKVMASIAKRIEETLNYEEILKERNLKGSTVTDAISYATCTTAVELNASAIVSSTSSGYTARMVSKFRPKTPIIAATDSDRTRRQLALSWGVYSVHSSKAENTDEVIEYSINASKESEYINQGELVVVTAGVPVGESGTTNLIKVHVISEEISTGMGVGRETVEGKVKIVKNGETCIDFNEGDILITSMTDADMNQYIEKAAAIVTECGGMTSHAAIVGINLAKPVVMSATGIMDKVVDGEIITVDAARGVVYRGSSRVL